MFELGPEVCIAEIIMYFGSSQLLDIGSQTFAIPNLQCQSLETQ